MLRPEKFGEPAERATGAQTRRKRQTPPEAAAPSESATPLVAPPLDAQLSPAAPALSNSEAPNFSDETKNSGEGVEKEGFLNKVKAILTPKE